MRQVVDVLHTSIEQNTYRLQCLLQMQESFHLLAGTRHRRTGPVEETHKAGIGLAQKIEMAFWFRRSIRLSDLPLRQ